MIGQCRNCGADEGLHHYQTNQCPVGGREETRDGYKQEWASKTFEPVKEDANYETAFPIPSLDQDGLTKREYFAAMAMQGLLADPTFSRDGGNSIAVFAVHQADALIAELNKETGE